MVAGVFHFAAGLLQLAERFFLLLPRNHDRVVRHAGARPLGGVEEVHLEVSNLHVHFFHAAPRELLFVRVDAPDDLAAQQAGVKLFRPGQILRVDGERSDGLHLHRRPPFFRLESLFTSTLLTSIFPLGFQIKPEGTPSMARVLVALLVLLLSGYGAASAQAPVRLASGYSAISGPHAVLWMAREAGLFEKNGLGVEVAYIRSGTTMAQALLAGELAIAQTGGPAAIQAAVGGADFVLVAVALNTTPIVLMGTVSRMEELKGKAIGVTRYGSNTDISARYALKKINLQPDKASALVLLGGYTGMRCGLQSGPSSADALC